MLGWLGDEAGIRLAVAATLLLVGCEGPAPLAPGHRAAAEAPEVEVTLLYTSDEHGWIRPYVADGQRRGGATELLARLLSKEGHCAGSLPPEPLPDCRGSTSLLLSGGDNYTGPAISSFFRGDTMARTMRRLGYAAAAFGNHELDFGHAQYRKNRATAELPYLAANLQRADGSPTDLVQPYVVIERGGARLGILGIATVSTPQTAAAHRFVGLAFADPVATIDRVLPELWATGVDAVVLLAHECHDLVAPWVADHPEWGLSFVGTGHCHRTSVELVGDVPVIGPDWRMQHYARVTLRIDRSKAPRERSRLVDYELVELSSAVASPESTADPELERLAVGWEEQVDRALGEVIGYTATGLGKRSPALGRWLVSSWRERFEADVAISTYGALRQELVPGPISLASISSIMPFDNELVVCTLPTEALLEMLAKSEVIVSGVVRGSDGSWRRASGEPLEPGTRLRVVTTDFLFYGGDGYAFHRYDPNPEVTGVNWREPVIGWTRAAASSSDRPLEQILRAAP